MVSRSDHAFSLLMVLYWDKCNHNPQYLICKWNNIQAVECGSERKNAAGWLSRGASSSQPEVRHWITSHDDSSLTGVYFRMRWPPGLETSFKYEIRYDSIPVIVIISLCQPPSVVQRDNSCVWLAVPTNLACQQHMRQVWWTSTLLSQHRQHMEVHNIIIRMKDSDIFVDKASTRRRAAGRQVFGLVAWLRESA